MTNRKEGIFKKKIEFFLFKKEGNVVVLLRGPHPLVYSYTDLCPYPFDWLLFLFLIFFPIFLKRKKRRKKKKKKNQKEKGKT